ncbi:hypothetical protein ACGFX7_18100 [Streptomyces harbinensis]|uniref:hypothetical protein n=1 Tax=Streptomyces harbinensis TaxID=1176198 RepID=UPI0037118F8F
MEDTLFCRVPGQPLGSRTLVRAVELLGPVGAAGRPGGRWYAQPSGEGRARETGLWFRASPEVLKEIEALLLAASWPGEAPVSVEYVGGGQRAPGSGPFRREPAGELSAASSELALAVAASGAGLPGAGAGTVFAVAHVGRVAELVPDAERAGFLFQCWQWRAAELAPGERRELAARAAAEAAGLLREAAGLRWPAGVRPAWDRYLRTAAALAAEAPPSPELPVNYLLFEHIRLTHRRLGIPAAAEALAARVVRAGLAGEAREGHRGDGISGAGADRTDRPGRSGLAGQPPARPRAAVGG